MRIFKYEMKFDGKWMEVSTLINSANTEIKNSLCTTEYKSVTNTCSFTLIPSEGQGLFYAQVQEKLLNARNSKTLVDIRISRLSDGEVLFGGYVDNSNLSITSTRRPDSTSISGNDYIAELLDKKINLNLVYENKSVYEIVSSLLREAGYTGTVEASEALNGKTCKYFVTTDDDDVTYRDIIDTLLFEVPGFVLYRNPATSIYEIRQIVSAAEPKRTVSYRIADKLVTNTKIFDKDGIKVTYPTVDVQTKRPVYVENISESSPAEIPAKHYYPENGDVQATYQEYDKNLLDRAYNTKETRLQNSDLDILYVKNPKLNIYPDNKDKPVFDFPVLETLEMPSNPVWYPRKAWILLRNKTDNPVNLELMNIEGDVVYKSKINNITLPAKATEPEEYKTSYIFDESHASEFAKWYYHMKTISSTTSSWVEVNLESSLGEKVIVSHKDSAVSQAHVVVQINNVSLGGGIRGYKITAVALSDFSSYEYAKDVRLNSSVGKTIFQEYNEYYNSDSFTELIGGSWSTTLTIDPNKTLWMRRVVKYIDGTYYYSIPAPSGSKGTDGEPGAPGAPGEDGSYISFDISRTIVDYYADNYPVDNTPIKFVAKSNLKTTITIDGKPVTNSALEVAHEVAPTVLFASKNSVVAVASNGRIQQSYSVIKNMLTGSLSLTADKLTVGYFADNVPHDADDKITLSVESANYKLAPKLYLNGTLQTTADSASYTFEVPQSMFKDTREITAKVTCGNDSYTLTLSKVTDAGSIGISCDKSEIGFYADNVPLNASEVATVSVYQTGYSRLPTLKIDGTEHNYTSTVLSDSATYVINASDLVSKAKITAEISIAQEIQSVSVAKRMEQATIDLSVSEGVAEYYYDNVAITGNMTATVSYSGLYYAPLLKAGNTDIALDDKGQGTIPITLFDNVEAGLAIKAYTHRYISYSTVVNVPKVKRPLVLSLGNSGSQFAYNSENVVSPETITLTNYTTGLSDKNKVTLVVNGVMKTWTDGKFIVTPSMVTGRYLTATISYGADSTSLIITKTFDGKAEIIEYSKSKSFKIYPDDRYEFFFSDEGLTYNGETMAWMSPWSKDQPDVSSNEYLWRRSRNSDADEWQYTRLTGIKGEDGKAGEYLGHFTQAPTTKGNGEDINDGDFYLNTSTPGSPLPYIYKDGAWLLVTSDNPQWSQIASATMSDVNNYGGALLSTSAYYGYFQALSAQKAFIASLGAQEITLRQDGVIKSENWDSTDGAEGWRIEADGDASFSSGTWRGAFANGLSFIPPVKMKITKSMSQKEAYRALKRAGLSTGYYTTEAYSEKFSRADSSMPIAKMLPPGFRCLDYDASKVAMNIPLNIGLNYKKVADPTNAQPDDHYLLNSIFGDISCIIPLTVDSWILFFEKEDFILNPSHVESPLLYTLPKILTLENLKKAYERTASISESFSGSDFKYPDCSDLLIDTDIFKGDVDIYPLVYIGCLRYEQSKEIATSPSLKYAKLHLYAPFFNVIHDGNRIFVLAGLDANKFSAGKIILCEYIPSTHRFEYIAGAKQQIVEAVGSNVAWAKNFTLDGMEMSENIDLRFNFFWCPIYQFNKVNDEYQLLAYNTLGYKLLKTKNFIDYTTIATITQEEHDAQLDEGYLFYSINVGRKIYSINGLQVPKDKPTYMFCSYDMDTKKFEVIPGMDYYSTIKYNPNVASDGPNASFLIGKLIYVKGIIYGCQYYIDKNSFFSYDTNTGEFKDLTKKLVMAAQYYLMDYGNGTKKEYFFENYSTVLQKPAIKDKYSRGVTMTSYIFKDIVYDEYRDALFIQMEGEIGLSLYYNLNTEKVSVFSPIYSLSKTYSMNSSSGYISENGKINFVDCQTMFVGGQDIGYTPFKLKNYTFKEFVTAADGGMDSASLGALQFGFTNDNESLFKCVSYSLMYAGYFLVNNGATFTDKSLDDDMRAVYDLDEPYLDCSALFPIIGINQIKIEEDENEYRICLASGMYNGVSTEKDFPTPKEENIAGGCWVNDLLLGESLKTKVITLTPQTNIEPFLVIKKNSEEPVGATCYINFPAQITGSDINMIFARSVLANK